MGLPGMHGAANAWGMAPARCLAGSSGHAALLVLFAGTAGAGIVAANLGAVAAQRRHRREVVVMMAVIVAVVVATVRMVMVVVMAVVVTTVRVIVIVVSIATGEGQVIAGGLGILAHWRSHLRQLTGRVGRFGCS